MVSSPNGGRPKGCCEAAAILHPLEAEMKNDAYGLITFDCHFYELCHPEAVPSLNDVGFPKGILSKE